MKFRDLCKLTETNEKAYEYAKTRGLCSDTIPICIGCHVPLHLEQGKKRHGLNIRWRCSKRNCRKSVSIVKNTIFEACNLDIKTVFDLIWAYSAEFTQEHAAEQSGVSRCTVNRFFRIISDIVTTLSSVSQSKIGGAGDIIEIDETHIFTRKHNRGRILSSQKLWVVGAISRNTKNIRLIATEKRSSDILTDFIVSNVDSDSVILTDMWRGYCRLTSEGYNHVVLNHSLYYVHPDDNTIHTNTIERVWRSLKDFLPKSLAEDALKRKIKEFEINYNKKIKKVGLKFLELCDVIKRHYN